MTLYAKFIDMYAGRLRNQVSFMLSACNFYMPIFEEALDAYGLPLELEVSADYRICTESFSCVTCRCFGPVAIMIGTGKIYGLESNSLIDERRDPISNPSCRPLLEKKEMYDIYGDWNLVIAAYNCGPGYQQGNPPRRRRTDYWKIYNLLPKRHADMYLLSSQPTT